MNPKKKVLLKAMKPKSLRRALDKLGITNVDRRKTGSMRTVLAKKSRANPVLLSGVMLKAELIDACVELADQRVRTRQRPSAESLSCALHSTGQIRGSAVPIWKAVYDDARMCESTIVLSAFYTNDMLRKLATGGAVKILLNGLSERRLRTQVAELSELQQEFRGDGRDAEIRIAFAPGIFHPKVYLFRTEEKKWIAWIGSANATSAALSRDAKNEEVMLRLDPAPDCLVEYAKRAWKTAHPIEDSESPVDSLSAFFQTGVLYYKPYTNLPLAVNPFRELMKGLQSEEKKRLVVINDPLIDEPDGIIGAFNIRRVYEREKSRHEAEDEKGPTLKIRHYSVETCYGLWVSTLFVDQVEYTLKNAARTKDIFYRGLRDWLKGDGRYMVIEEFRDYLLRVRKTMDEYDVDWKSALARRQSANPFVDVKPIEDRIDIIIANLSEDARRHKLSQALVEAAVPTFSDDLEAAGEFERTFFEALEVQSFRDGRRSNAARSFFDAVDIRRGATAKEIRRKLETCLTDPEWYKNCFLAQKTLRSSVV